MTWPLPQDFNEAVQNPATAFADSDLKDGQAVVGPTGLPLPRSGNFADVYQIRASNSKDWAVKCFTRPVTGLGERYKKVDDALKKASLPFTIGFAFQNEGVMVRGEWRPAVKMEWVDGLQLNQVVRVQAGNPRVLDALGQMWSRLCRKLRESGIAHADLQHGNVLLVAGSKPGSYGLKLIDYDGMYVPSLANTPSGESGHPNYQHPQRAGRQVYSPDLDRFPHLVIATALKGLAVLGPKLWEKYDTGDNLLFTEEDFKSPAWSALMKELWDAKDPGLQALVGHLAIACGKPIPQTPWLDQIAPEGVPTPLTPEQARNAAAVLNVAPPPSAAVLPVQAAEYGVELVEPTPPTPSNAFSDLETSPSAGVELPPRKKVREPLDDDRYDRRRRPVKKASLALPLAIGGGVLALVIAAVAAVVFLGGDTKPDETVQNKNDDDRNKEKPKPTEKEKEQPKPPDVPVPPKKDPILPPKKDPVEPQAFNFEPDGVPELTMRWRGLTTGVSAGARFSANSEFVVVKDGGDTKSVRVYSSNNGSKLAGFTEGETALVDFAVLLDNNICSWHADQPFAIVWSPATGKAVGRIPVRNPPFAPGPKIFDVSPDGKYVVVGHAAPPGPKRDEPGRVLVLEAESGKELMNVSVFAPKFRWVDAEFVIVDSDQIRHYRLPGATVLRTGKLDFGNRLLRVLGVAANGNVALHPGAGLVTAIDMNGGKMLATFPQRFSPMHGAISDDGRLVALCTPSNKQNGELVSHVEVMDLQARKLIGRYPLGTGAVDVSSIAIAPDNSAMAITRSGRRVDFVDLPKPGAVAVVPKKEPEPPVPPDPPQGAVGDATVKWTKALTGRGASFWFSPDGKTLFVHRSAESNIETYDVETGVAGTVYMGKRYQEFGWIVKLDDGRVFTEVRSGQVLLNSPVFLWDFKTGEELGSAIKPEWLPPEKEKSWISNVMSPNGRFVFSARNGPGKPGEIGKPYEEEEAPYRLTDTTSGKNVLSSSWRGGSVMFTRDSKWLVIYDSRGLFTRMKPEAGGEENSWNAPVTSPMVKSILGVNSDASLVLFQGVLKDKAFGTHVVDARSGKALLTLPKQSRGDWSGLSEDGKLAGTVEIHYGDKFVKFSVQLFDVQSGRLVSRVSFDQDINLVASVKFAPDMKRFVVSEGPKRRFAVYEFKHEGEVAVVPKKDPPAAGKRGDGWQERWARDVPIRTSVFWFSGDSQHALLASFGNAPKLESFDLKTGELVANYTGGVLEGPALQFVSKQDFGQVFAVTYSGNPLFWSFNNGKLIENFIKPDMLPKGDGAPAWLLSPNNKRLLAARLGKNKAAPGEPAELEPASYQLLDMNTGAVLFGGNWSGGSAMFSADSKWLMLYDAAGVFHRVNATTGAIEFTLQTPRNSPRGNSIQALTRDGGLMVFAGALRGLPNGTRVVETPTGRVVATLPRDAFAGRCVISPDGKFVGMPISRGNQAFSAIVIEVASGKTVREAKFNFDPNYSATLHFTPDLKSFGFTEDKRAVMYDFIDDLVAVAPKKDPDPMPKKDPDPPPVPKKDPPKPIERVPMPEEAAIAKAETKLRGLLKDDYARKSPSERKALVVKLLGLADETADDPAFRYVMLRDARDIAVEVFEASLAVQALDGIIRLYTVDGDTLRIATFEKIRDAAGNTTTLRAVTDMAMAASDLALASDNHAAASRYAQIALTAAKRGNLPAQQVEEADSQFAKCQKAADAFKPVAEALTRLMKNGNDEEACTLVGQHRCFVQGRWSEGLPLLAKGSSGDIRTAAALDAAAPKTPPMDTKVADAWWQAAEAAFDLEKLGARYRARHWYARALPALQGEARTLAENRLGFNSGGTDYRAGLIAEFTAKVPSILQGKKARLEAGIDFNAGEFKADGAGIATDLAVKWSGAIAPPRAGRHRIVVNATDPVIVRIDGKVILDTSAKGARRDGLVILPDRPVPIAVEFKCINTDKHSVKLLWSTPGSDLEELIPPEALSHDKKSESVISK